MPLPSLRIAAHAFHAIDELLVFLELLAANNFT
jgi:hypothetical protein